MNSQDIEKFMREAGRGEHDLTSIRTFAARAADEIKAQRQKFIWRNPRTFPKDLSMIVVLIEHAGQKTVLNRIFISREGFDADIIGWLPSKQFVDMEIEP